MERDTLSFPQLVALLFGALLGPVSELLPGTAVRGGVLGAVGILPAVILLFCAGIWMGTLARYGGNFAQGLKGVFGNFGGNAVLLLYMVWFQFLFILRLRLSAQRLLSGGTRDGAVWFFLFALGGMTLWMAHGTLGTLGRTAQLFFLILMLFTVGILVLSLGEMERGNMLPDRIRGMKEIGDLLWPGMQALGYGLFVGILWEPPEQKRFYHSWLIWCLLAGVVLVGIQLVVLGCFGAALTQSMEIPLFHLSKSVGIEGAFQRIESLVTSVWIFSDLLLLTGSLWGMKRIGSVLYPELSEQTVITASVLSGVVIALAAFGDKISAVRIAQSVGTAGNLFLGAGIPLISVLILRIRRGTEKRFKKSEKSA